MLANKHTRSSGRTHLNSSHDRDVSASLTLHFSPRLGSLDADKPNDYYSRSLQVGQLARADVFTSHLGPARGNLPSRLYVIAPSQRLGDGPIRKMKSTPLTFSLMPLLVSLLGLLSVGRTGGNVRLPFLKSTSRGFVYFGRRQAAAKLIDSVDLHASQHKPSSRTILGLA